MTDIKYPKRRGRFGYFLFMGGEMDVDMRLGRSLNGEQKLFLGKRYIVRLKRVTLRVKEPDV